MHDDQLGWLFGSYCKYIFEYLTTGREIIVIAGKQTAVGHFLIVKIKLALINFGLFQITFRLFAWKLFGLDFLRLFAWRSWLFFSKKSPVAAVGPPTSPSFHLWSQSLVHSTASNLPTQWCFLDPHQRTDYSSHPIGFAADPRQSAEERARKRQATCGPHV